MLKDNNFSLNKESFWLFVVRVALCDGSAMFLVVPPTTSPSFAKEGFGEEYEYKRAPALHSFYM